MMTYTQKKQRYIDRPVSQTREGNEGGGQMVIGSLVNCFRPGGEGRSPTSGKTIISRLTRLTLIDRFGLVIFFFPPYLVTKKK